MQQRQQRVHTFNTALQDRCHYYNTTSTNTHKHNTRPDTTTTNDDNDDDITASASVVLPRFAYYDVEDEVLDYQTQQRNTAANSISTDRQGTEKKDDELVGIPRVKDRYRDVSQYNIHLVHEPLLQLWIQKTGWSWFQKLTIIPMSSATGNRDNTDVSDTTPENTSRTITATTTRSSPSFMDYLQETFNAYRKTKPWATRVSVIETDGLTTTTTT